MKHHRIMAESLRRARPASLLIPWLLLAADAGGQDVIAAIDGDQYFESFGAATAPLGDIDGDGVTDFAVSAPNYVLQASPGEVRVYSGADRALLFEFVGLSSDGEFGAAVAGAGDVDLDGVPDLIVGAPNSSLGAAAGGTVSVLSGEDGARLLHLVGASESGRLGLSVAGIGDIDQDGGADFAIGHPGQSEVRLVSGRTGSTVAALVGASTDFGEAVAGGGDVDQDGVGDIFVTAPNEGAWHVYSGATFGLVRTIEPVGSGIIRRALAFVGDVDGDGSDDMMVGHMMPWSHKAAVYSGATGEVLYTYVGITGMGAPVYDAIGRSVSAAGDVDGDGRPDFAAGAPVYQTATGSLGGLVRVWSGKDGSLLMSTEATKSPDGIPFHNFGSSISLVGDVNLDGKPDLLVGAAEMASPAMTSTGRAFLISTAKIKPVAHEIPIVLGDKVIGEIHGEHLADALTFDGLGGAKVTIELDNAGDGLAPLVSVEGPTDHPAHQELHQWQLFATASKTKKSFVLPSTGSYSVRIEGADGTAGGYKVKTKAKLPDELTSKKASLSASKPGLSFVALPGATVDLKLKPKGSSFPFTYMLMDPSGATVDLTGHVVIKPSGTVKIVDLPLLTIGTYQVKVSGFPSYQHVVKLKVKVDQPKGNATVTTE